MPNAEIITIGTEILLGEIIDTNAAYMARELRNAGINLFWKTSVGDNVERIALAINQALSRSEIVITTGGLGPTIDDPTREAVATAIGVCLEYREDLWEQIQDRFRAYGSVPTENNKRQAYIPAGATPIPNPVGTAPCFIFEKGDRSVISLPGVPREMEHLLQNEVLPYLKKRYDIQAIIKTRILHTAGIGESTLDDNISDLEHLSNPTIGLAAHGGWVDIRIGAKAISENEADAMIQQMEDVLRDRLGNNIYGVDEERLEDIALKRIEEKGWSVGLIESGLGGEMIRIVSRTDSKCFKGGEVIANIEKVSDLITLVKQYRKGKRLDFVVGITCFEEEDRQRAIIVWESPLGVFQWTRTYGGPPKMAPRWAITNCLNLIRLME
ncbi:MAG: CinA family nicotinamide mononucleotide deamidase-related protein [Anaerolineales bacterium]|nr:CinA family nicotinamide mononucleotide deamidase-related protein [Anaerolineales bacterium]